jgi:exosortase
VAKLAANLPEVTERSGHHKLLLPATFVAASVPLYWVALRELAHLVWMDEGYSHILVVPFVVAWFLWNSRGDLLRGRDGNSMMGAGAVIGLGAVGYAAGWILARHGNPAHLTVWMLSLVCMWIGGFVLALGSRAALKAVFPLAFLLLVVPVPVMWMHYLIRALQHASSEVTYLVYRLLGEPVYRDGFMFTLPGLKIEIAQECSGIRSSISLLLTTIIAVHLALKSKLNKLLLIALVVPIAIFKNVLRIVTLSLLAMYVDRSFITGSLHHKGGFVFFLLALGVVFGAIKLLRHFEERQQSVQSQLHLSVSGV